MHTQLPLVEHTYSIPCGAGWFLAPEVDLTLGADAPGMVGGVGRGWVGGFLAGAPDGCWETPRDTPPMRPPPRPPRP